MRRGSGAKYISYIFAKLTVKTDEVHWKLYDFNMITYLLP